MHKATLTRIVVFMCTILPCPALNCLPRQKCAARGASGLTSPANDAAECMGEARRLPSQDDAASGGSVSAGSRGSSRIMARSASVSLMLS